MRDRVGEDFDAMILNATKYGLFVELDNLFVEGLVPIDSLRDDHYTFRENTREIIGSRNRRKFFMGQRVRVVLDRIDSIQKRLQFALIGEGTGDGTALSKAPRKSGKSKATKDGPGKKATAEGGMAAARPEHHKTFSKKGKNKPGKDSARKRPSPGKR
jgi:ribonuclease R